MQCKINTGGFFAVALSWNLAVIVAGAFLGSWILDVVGSVTASSTARGFAYGVALITTIAMVFFGLLAATLSSVFKCTECGAGVMSFRFPFLVSLYRRPCQVGKITINESKPDA